MELAKLEQAVIDQFLLRFFHRPTEQEIKSDYTQYSSDGGMWRYDDVRLTRYFSAVFQDFMDLADGEIPTDISQKFAEQAEAFVALEPTFRKYTAETIVNQSRLTALIKHPAFVADEVSLQVIENLAGMSDSFYVPWDSGMYSEQDVKARFGPNQIEGFHRLIKSDKVWNSGAAGKYFISVAKALAVIAENFPTESIEARFDLVGAALANETKFGKWDKVDNILAAGFEGQISEEDLKSTATDWLFTSKPHQLAAVRILSQSYGVNPFDVKPDLYAESGLRAIMARRLDEAWAW